MRFAIVLLLFVRLAPAHADVCPPGPGYPIVVPIVVWYPWIPLPPTLPFPTPVPNPTPSPEPPPEGKLLPESPRKQPPKPPLMPTDAKSPKTLLPKEIEEKPFSVFVVQRSEGNRKEEGYRVKFFNHGERDLILEVEGQEVKLARGEFVKLKLAREFSWKEKGGETHHQAIPPDSPGLDIVIRK